MRICIYENTTLKELDEYINLVASKKHQNIDIEIPLNLDNFFSLSVSLVQLIATWERKYIKGKLIIDIDYNNLPSDTDIGRVLKKLYYKEYVYPVISIVWKTKEIVNKKNQNLTSILKNKHNDFLNDLRSLDVKLDPQIKEDRKEIKRKGNRHVGYSISLINTDNLKKNLGVLPFLERNNRFAIEELFSENIDSIINDYIIHFNKQLFNDKIKPVKKDLIAIMFELMKNTFEWGKIDDVSQLNIRGAILKHHRIHLKTILKKTDENHSLIEYLSDEKLTSEESGYTDYIEISVIDAGEGFLNKTSDNFKEGLKDIDVVKKCLKKNETNAIGIEGKDKGKGLFRILKILDGKGFLRIKTDKFCLYRNLINQPILENDPMDIYDWYSDSTKSYTEKPECSGTVISIFYPLI